MYCTVSNVTSETCFVFFSFISPVGVFRTIVISQHVRIQFTAKSFSHSGYVLMEPFTVIVRGGSHVSLEKKIHVGLQEIKFQWHVASHGTVWGKWILHDFYILSWFISQNVVACSSNRFISSSLRSIQFIFEVGCLEKTILLVYLRKCLPLSWTRWCAENFASHSRILRLLLSSSS